MTAKDLVLLLESFSLPVHTEAEMQAALERSLSDSNVFFDREVRLGPRDRIDFIVGDIGVEMKTQGSLIAVRHQLQRYAQSPRVREILLFTSKAKLCQMPKTLSGKKIHVAYSVGRYF